MSIRLRQTAAGRILIGLGIVGFGIGLVYFIQFGELASVMFEVLDGINSVSDAAKNGRGDKAYIRTDTAGGWSDPNKTRLRLRLADHWFSTTLVETDSFGVEESLKWRNDDNLDVSLGFGCLVHMTQPVEQVGPVRISYHFKDGDKALSKDCPD
ncbi:MAG: hypothetical protein ACREFH_12340 [Stellaceae bacterium]